MIKFKRVLLSVLAMSLWSQASIACSCSYGGKFVEYAKDATVIKGKITQYGPKLTHGETLYQDMEVEILDVIQGKFSHQSVKLLGDPGHLCRPYIDSKKYAINSTFLIALQADASIQPFLGCGESAVLIKDNKVYGQDFINGQYRNYEAVLKQVIVELQHKNQ